MATLSYGPVQEDLALVEEMLESLKRVDYPPLAQMLSLALAGGGKRLRPAVTLLTGKFGSYPLDKLVALATSIELLHTATLVHDDVIDNAHTRRGRPTTNSAFHNSTSVMLGDYMFAHAADLVCRTASIRVIRLFSRTLMAMAHGEIHQDLSAYDASQTIRSYLQRIGGKTASLFVAAAEGGAIIAEVPEDGIEALGNYGYNLGIAFQIVDDILDFVGDEAEMGKPAGSDLMQGTLTLPSLLLMERYPSDNPIAKLFTSRRRQQHLARALEMIRNSTIIDDSYAVARDFSQRAIAALERLPAIPARNVLADLALYVLDRRS